MFRNSTVLTLALWLAGAHWALAQTPAKDAVKARLSASVCDCLTKKSATSKPENLNKTQVKQVFVECFGGAAGKDMKGIQQAYGQTAFSNGEAMRTMGEEVGALLVQSCPPSMRYFMAMTEDHSTSAATSGQTVGKLGGLSDAGLPQLEVQAGTEKSYFAWVRQFDQAPDLLSRLPQLQGRQARISWEEVEVLQPTTHQYQKVREITGIELL